MGKLLLALVLCSCNPSQSGVLNRIVDSTVIVQSSSGVVVYSDEEQSLVLTACHVVKTELFNAKPIMVGYLVQDKYGLVLESDMFEADDVECDEDNDLAVLKIYPERRLTASPIARVDPKLGDDIWISANPNFNYHSLKKGIVSSTARYGYWELSGGIIFGSSGGGAFNQRGEVFGVAHTVDSYNSHYCPNDMAGECFRVMLSDFGFFVRPDVLRAYLLQCKFHDKFKYLKQEN
jgi:S1-C subfamily serine protease